MSVSRRDLITKGIILRKTKYRETSLILEVFSPKFGLIAIMAKGVRKQNSKSTGLLEILNELDLTLYKNPQSEWYIFKEAELIKSHLNNVSYETSILMQAAVEIYRQLISDLNDFIKLYELLKQYLEYTPNINTNGITIFWRFLSRLFTIIGIEINLNKCVICEKEKPFYAYYPQKHGFICRECYRPVYDNFLIKLSAQQSEILGNLRQIGNLLNELKLEKQTIRQLNRIFLLHLSEHFHKRFYLKSLELLN